MRKCEKICKRREPDCGRDALDSSSTKDENAPKHAGLVVLVVSSSPQKSPTLAAAVASD